MPDLSDGESIEIKGSARRPYLLKNSGGVYSCTCPAWRNQSLPIERRTCKHLRQIRGADAERQRVGGDPSAPPPTRRAAEEAPELLLAQTWTNAADLAGWWMSEKLDGVRAWWDGRQFRSRLGNVFHAPDWFVGDLPDSPLDGELWLGRKAFQRTVSIVRRQDRSDLWREIVFVVFDAPAVDAQFEERLAHLREVLARGSTYARPLDHERCQGIAHLRAELARVESLGGEGLMLREPGSRYEAGRSSTLLKVKTFHDAEARVVEHLAGAGRHEGRLGALAVELADGTSFSVGTGFSDAQREIPPPVGSTITFRYQELSDRGVPRFPSFVRVNPSDLGMPAAPANPQPRPSQSLRACHHPVQGPQTMPRRYEYVADKSAKFWEIETAGPAVTVRFGRLGTQGQTQTKTFPDDAAATRHAEKLIAEKTGKGYVEVKDEG